MIVAALITVGSTVAQAQRGETANGNQNPFDIGIIIDNRPRPADDAANADIDALIGMLDRQMYFEHVMLFERPPIDVVCDVFGCPLSIEEPNPFPSLLWQITREGEARIFVYYIGDGRIEGVERHLPFRRTPNGDPADGVGYPVWWLHRMIKDAGPSSAVLMLDSSFSPRPLPCADEDPELIDDELFEIRRTYLRIAREHWNRTNFLELSATTPVQPAHCDRFDQVLEGIDEPMFTKFLLKGIVEGEADAAPFGDEDRLIELGELTDYLDDRIERAARFQWGRQQNVRAVGSRGKVLASVDPRPLRADTAAILERRERDAARMALLNEIGLTEDGLGGEAGAEDGAPGSEGLHPCVAEPGGLACAERCSANGDDAFCADNLTSSTEESNQPADGAPPGRDLLPAQEIELVRLEDEPSATCRFVIDQVSPYASALVERIRGDVQPSCDWAADRSEVERGPFAQIFTPIAWRLGKSSVQDAVMCALDCGGLASPIESAPTAPPSEAPRLTLDAAPPPEPAPVRIESAYVDPRTLGPFHRQICDRLHEPQPSYIGLPRWMPGTLIVSEALRAGYGCPPPPPEPELPTPIALAIEPPPAPEPPPVLTTDDRLGRWRDRTADVQTEAPPAPDEGRQPEVESPPAESEVDIVDATPPAEPEVIITEAGVRPFVPTVSKVRWLQSALTVDNRSPGPIDGTIGSRTQDAIQSWRQDNDRGERSGWLTETEFQEIIEAFGRRFDQVHERVRSF